MADSRKLALSHEERLRTGAMEGLKRHLLASQGGDSPEAAELSLQLQRLDRTIITCQTLRKMLETSRKIRGPSFEMIDGVTRLIGEVTEAAEARTAGAALADLVRQKIVQFASHLKYIESLTR